MKIGVAFAGGGLKGVAHIGALKALKELGINIEYVSGTSSGSVVAALYAMGYSTDEMSKIVEESYKTIIKIKKTRLTKSGIKSLLERKIDLQGLIDGEDVEKTIKKYTDQKNMNIMSDIPQKLAIVSTDCKTTKKCVFISKEIEKQKDVEYLSDIPIGKAIRASMAFPAIFTPCEYKEYCFMDGGTVDNLPVKELIQMGAEKTIALSFKLDEFSGNENLFGIILRACDIFSLKDVKRGQDISDINIEIDMKNAKLLKIDDIHEGIKIGYQTVMQNKEKILGMVK